MNKIRFIFDRDIWISSESFLKIVADAHDIQVEEMMKKSRIAKYVTARAAAIYILRTHTTLTAVNVGEIFGKDHASVLHHYNSVWGKIRLGFGKEYKINAIKSHLMLSDIDSDGAMLDALVRESISWGEDKGLKDVKAQSMKLVEEVGELMAAILKDKREYQIDSIGDIMVVLSILSHQLGINITDAFGQAYNEIKHRTGNTVNGSFIKSEDL
jgi:NTP pyrophosphatase (non-canonical NTP hydrolase)